MAAISEEFRATLLDKSAAKEMIDNLPDDATWEDLQYQIYVRQVIERGRADVAAGRVTPVAEVRKKFGLD